ncbi:MAG: hypothetical protein V7698_18125 [Paracoccaceae bacterium]|uniref:hypothetical protein n=1 Tax=unclassified Seohaeicola TaxID=2641111 RepID=UPI00237A4803|nr:MULTISPECIES: hypothetical protein [unclassified Seohaeicola]MDD9709556.1 hypothetical protein [Seohaeicola sp. 4SK31]MDD9737800.1 hypothetical protein [Seohaeicola sp. SP36]
MAKIPRSDGLISQPFANGKQKFCQAAFRSLGTPIRVDVRGPELTFAVGCDAAEQFHETGHSCIVQYSEMAIDGFADEAAVRYCAH